MFEGAMVALVTPFKNHELHEDGFRRLIRYQIQNGVDHILVSGCTGEAATLTMDEVATLISWSRKEIERADRSVSLLVGTGTNNTKTTVERTAAVEKLGVDGVLVITPYYNKPTPAGLIAHFTRIAENTSLPIILYNVPGRTGTNMLPETVMTLAKLPNIVALKEASGNLDQVSRLRAISDITILCGDDTLTLPMMAVGANGVISVTANVAPHRVSQMVNQWKSGDYAGALATHLTLFELSRTLFIETNPMPVKAALSLMGLIENELRLPLVPVKEENMIIIRNALLTAGLLKG